MSELNKKLNALSQRQNGHDPIALKPAAIRPIERPQPWRLAGVGVIALGLVGGLVWWQGSPAERAEAESTFVHVAASVVPVAPAMAMAAEPVVSVPVISTHVEPATAHTEGESSSLVQEPQQVMPPSEEVEAEMKTQTAQKIASKPSATHATTVKSTQPKTAAVAQTKTHNSPSLSVVKPAPVAKPQRASTPTVHAKSRPVAAPVTTVQVDDEAEGLMIESVELNAAQLAKIEYQKAEKALKQGDSRKAISFLDAAITYQPEWVEARQKLAALYYGRRESRQALATLQQGLALDAEQPELRLTMAKLLLNESQQSAALNVLNQLPRDGSRDYLAMRGALAQQLNNNVLALSSYQHLVEDEPYDGRWWMGLGIALERSQALSKARQAYQQALLMGQISNQSQQFIQQRLTVLGNQEG
ncbi:tetratricopeptide repeat protein [Photobacterium nomapromontoriensis]|uniref:tetratricopeptide repeat protein n=1 Tax=Photobacterium nomapromontoriensis TaxID=2910237 RepID=UPI003D0F0A3A